MIIIYMYINQTKLKLGCFILHLSFYVFTVNSRDYVLTLPDATHCGATHCDAKPRDATPRKIDTIPCIQYGLTWQEICGDNAACRGDVLVVSDSKFHVVLVVADSLQCHVCVRDIVDRFFLPNSATLTFVVYNNSFNVIASAVVQFLYTMNIYEVVAF